MKANDMRAGDLDREAAITRLGNYFVSGHLHADELADRTSKVLEARTKGDISELTMDLPELPVPSAHPVLRRWVRSWWGLGFPLLLSIPGAWAGAGVLDHVHKGNPTGVCAFMYIVLVLYGVAAFVFFLVWGDHVSE